MVERSLRVREVPGSSPGTPTEKIHYLFKYLQGEILIFSSVSVN